MTRAGLRGIYVLRRCWISVRVTIRSEQSLNTAPFCAGLTEAIAENHAHDELLQLRFPSGESRD
jgi:hypothetical protein